MKQAYVLVEGQTEETFVKEIVAPHLHRYEVSIIPVIVKTKRIVGGPHYRGGVVNYGKVKKDLMLLLQNTAAVSVTTMLDLYRLPGDFPGYDAATGQGVEKALKLEQALRQDIKDPRLLPYLQVHEFEALLFSDPQKFSYVFSRNEVQQLAAVTDQFSNPEDINETTNGSPSKRLLSIVGEGQYQKALHGPIIALEIELPTMREKCPHFDDWLQQLENL